MAKFAQKYLFPENWICPFEVMLMRKCSCSAAGAARAAVQTLPPPGCTKPSWLMNVPTAEATCLHRSRISRIVRNGRLILNSKALRHTSRFPAGPSIIWKSSSWSPVLSPRRNTRKSTSFAASYSSMLRFPRFTVSSSMPTLKWSELFGRIGLRNDISTVDSPVTKALTYLSDCFF